MEVGTHLLLDVEKKARSSKFRRKMEEGKVGCLTTVDGEDWTTTYTMLLRA